MLRFEIHRDHADRWRWRLIAANGRLVADSGEGYASEHNALRAAVRTQALAPQAAIVRRDGTRPRLAETAAAADHPDPF
ncbi:DUF1508 domain-containing protein [Luteimonas sp. Y-2-2-4F]|nr:DUF1508 domain-containing protein [Luteimonas sp. Y-2-2-4F]MCD9031198.1 DUF1508 domain-containing protein [Luteimonas sp. Y-2-2-4F]